MVWLEGGMMWDEFLVRKCCIMPSARSFAFVTGKLCRAQAAPVESRMTSFPLNEHITGGS